MTERKKNIVVSLIFLSLIVSVFIINIYKEDIDISLSERRKLAQFPELSLSNIIKGKFSNEFDNYSMDQFIKREEFRKLKANFEMKVLNKKDFNGIYEYNDMLIKQEYPLNEKSVLNLVKKINEIEQKYLNETNKKYYSIIPDKNYYTDGQEYLKMDYEKLVQILQETLKNMKYIDIFDCLNLSDYYYTDIHWKQESLRIVLNKIATEMNFKNRINNDFMKLDVMEFKGVYSGQYPLESKNDKIRILTNEIIASANVYNFDTQKQSTVYDLEKIKSNDKYDIYLSGASSILEIQNPNSKSKKELIVFRDSFASSLVPLFIEAYEKITLIDIRYINLNLLEQYVEFDNKDVLFLYSTSIINNSESTK